ncbi:MAG: CDP-glucose 4,6-dehydratase [Gammaproteobacteria bacterium]|nr:CDP-glucose 4,6-dehydratase [Gammaproteobacteria bacterium]
MFADVFHGRRVLVTGHTGFKGSWLTLWLTELGAEVMGVALEADTSPNHWQLLELNHTKQKITDIRDGDAVTNIVSNFKPEIVFHLAAQPLVRRSYLDPIETWSTNVMGAANVLEACRQVDTVKAIVVVTSDKCYENRGLSRGYRETDTLGGHDPYSASKAATELVVDSYRRSYFNDAGILVATARGGNVIGGGDWAEDRLIPDLVRSIDNQQSLEIRSPLSTRPWQHVLDVLSGYLMLGQQLYQGNNNLARAWNFGPEPASNLQVEHILLKLKSYWPAIEWHINHDVQPHEAHLLYLDNSDVKAELGWRPLWELDETLSITAQWYQQYLSSAIAISSQQLQDYISCAKSSQSQWCH